MSATTRAAVLTTLPSPTWTACTPASQSVDLVLDDDNKNKLSNIDNQATNTDNSPAIFAVYDDDRYIIGAVVVGEDENNTKNYAYALKSAQNEYKGRRGQLLLGLRGRG